MYLCKCLKTDLMRMLTGYRWIGAMLGVAASLLFSLERIGIVNGSVLTTYVHATIFTGSIAAYIFCELPFAVVFCEDLENKYIYYQAVRGNLKGYVISKTTVIFFSAVLAMMTGTAVFTVICRIQAPWTEAEKGVEKFLLAGSYAGLLRGGHYFAYCMVYAFQLGLLAGILSLAAAYLSLYLSNRVMVLALPVFMMQLLVEYRWKGGFSVLSFRPYNRFLEKDWQCALFLLLVSVGIAGCIGLGIYKKLKRRL